jgi:hypothetical protein
VEASEVKKRRPRRLLWWVLTTTCALAVIVVVGIGCVYRAAQYRPAFYERALSAAPERQREAGDELERQVLELHNDVRRRGRWQATFTDEQINGWLASDLEEKFPKLLPQGVVEPRVAIETELARVACRYESKSITSVVSLDVEVHLTDEPNVVALRIHRARAGALPLPLKSFLDRITHIAAQSDLQLRWVQEDGDQVALFTIPAEHEDYATQGIHLDTVELRDGAIYVAGRSGTPPAPQVAASSRSSVNIQR